PVTRFTRLRMWPSPISEERRPLRYAVLIFVTLLGGGTALAAPPDAARLAERIDHHLAARWRAEEGTPAPPPDHPPVRPPPPRPADGRRPVPPPRLHRPRRAYPARGGGPCLPRRQGLRRAAAPRGPAGRFGRPRPPHGDLLAARVAPADRHAAVRRPRRPDRRL